MKVRLEGLLKSGRINETRDTPSAPACDWCGDEFSVAQETCIGCDEPQNLCGGCMGQRWSETAPEERGKPGVWCKDCGEQFV